MHKDLLLITNTYLGILNQLFTSVARHGEEMVKIVIICLLIDSVHFFVFAFPFSRDKDYFGNSENPTSCAKQSFHT